MAEPTPTVYSYYPPEIRHAVQNAISDLNSETAIGSQSIHYLLRQNYQPGLDDLHLPLMAKYERFARSEGIIGLDTFKEKYFTNGSSEAIFHIIAGLMPDEPLYQFEGEYQGYQAFADSIGRKIVTVKNATELRLQPSGTVILSNPMSKSGNALSNAYVRELTDRHKVILDLAYMGMTQEPLNLDLTNEFIVAVVGSLSKPFGLYYYRIGFCYSRYPILSLYGNRWFKNALSIKIGEAVLDEWTPAKAQAFKHKYFKLQARAVRDLNETYNLDNKGGDAPRRARGSDVWLLANAIYRESDPGDLRPFKRYDRSDYRFCLTPYFMEYLNG